MHTQLASLVSLFICMYNARVHTYVVTNPLPCGEISRVAFIWDELAEMCGEVLRVTGFRGMAKFQEMQYIYQDIRSMCYYVLFELKMHPDDHP